MKIRGISDVPAKVERSRANRRMSKTPLFRNVGKFAAGRSAVRPTFPRAAQDHGAMFELIHDTIGQNARKTGKFYWHMPIMGGTPGPGVKAFKSKQSKKMSLPRLYAEWAPPLKNGGIFVENGHDYWWFLEYGTAGQSDYIMNEGGKQVDFGSNSRAVRIRLRKPPAVKPHKSKFAAYKISAHLRQKYEHVFNDDGTQAGWYDKNGKWRPRMRKRRTSKYRNAKVQGALMFKNTNPADRDKYSGSGYYKSEGGKDTDGYVFRRSVRHPGVRARGVFRSEIWRMRKQIAHNVRAFVAEQRANGTPPYRTKWQSIVNSALIDCHQAIVDRLPRSKDVTWVKIDVYSNPPPGGKRRIVNTDWKVKKVNVKLTSVRRSYKHLASAVKIRKLGLEYPSKLSD